MSRIGKQPVVVPAGVEVTVDGSKVTVKGPKGTLTDTFNSEISIKVEGNEIIVTRPSDDKDHRALHGLTRTLVNNMVIGVTTGYEKKLEVLGVGYRAQKQGTNLVMNLGYSHQVIIPEEDGITIEVPAPTERYINGKPLSEYYDRYQSYYVTGGTEMKAEYVYVVMPEYTVAPSTVSGRRILSI